MISNTALYNQLLDLEKIIGVSYTGILKKSLEDNIREENAKLTGCKSELSIIKKMFKEKDCSQWLKDVYNDYDNRYMFTDGFRIFVANSDLGYKAIEPERQLSNTDSFFKTDLKYNIDINTQDLQTFIALNKSEKKPIYIFDINGVKCGVNANYLLDSIKFTGSNKFYCDCNVARVLTGNGNKKNISMYYQIDDNGKFLSAILPINIK